MLSFVIHGAHIREVRDCTHRVLYVQALLSLLCAPVMVGYGVFASTTGPNMAVAVIPLFVAACASVAIPFHEPTCARCVSGNRERTRLLHRARLLDGFFADTARFWTRSLLELRWVYPISCVLIACGMPEQVSLIPLILGAGLGAAFWTLRAAYILAAGSRRGLIGQWRPIPTARWYHDDEFGERLFSVPAGEKFPYFGARHDTGAGQATPIQATDAEE